MKNSLADGRIMYRIHQKPYEMLRIMAEKYKNALFDFRIG